MQHFDGLLNRRFIDVHRSEAPFKGGVFLDVLVILVEGGSADALQFTARKRWLEHIRSVHCSLSGTSTNHGVQLIDHEDDIALRALDLFDGGLQALLELAPEA